MFCKYCGNKLPENANFCPVCGKINEDAAKDEEVVSAALEVVIEQPNEPNESNEQESEDPFEKEKEELGGQILKYAILGLAFGITVWLSLLGLIFSIVSRSKLSNYISKFHETDGRATVGKSLSVAALAVSITFTCIMFIIILAAIFPGL